MGIMNKIMAGLATLGSIAAAIFYVLFKQAKDEQKALEKENQHIIDKMQDATVAAESERASKEAGIEYEKKIEDDIKTAHSSNNLDAFNAVNRILSDK